MQLSELIPAYTKLEPAIEVQGIKLDSRKVASGDLFIAIQGHQVDGRNFIDAAIEAGACAVLMEGEEEQLKWQEAVPLIVVPQLAQRLSALAGRFYGEPSKKIALTGVTGTNGKTTVSHLLAQLWSKINPPVAVMGTAGSGLLGELLPEVLTTPDAVTVQQRLASFVAQGATYASMEVSSHALSQHRVSGLVFDTVIATNISRDHLDYHGSMKAYAAAKQRLFTDFSSRKRILNADDLVVSTWGTEDDYWFSLDAKRVGHSKTLVAINPQYTAAGTEMTLCWEHESLRVHSPLLGEFNIQNVLAATVTLLASGLSLKQVDAYLQQLQGVPGRMEMFHQPGQASVIVDYAHTPDALQKVLLAARNHCVGKLWVVFGCGGDRDRGKRPQMGQVAAQYADCVVVTDDNPRTEEPELIIEDIVAGIRAVQKPGLDYHQVIPRCDAIAFALEQAAPEDVIVCAGKGHETEQIVGTRSIAYDERAYVQGLLTRGQQ